MSCGKCGTDKKKKDGKLRFILVRSAGDAFIAGDVHRSDALAVLASMKAGRYPVPDIQQS